MNFNLSPEYYNIIGIVILILDVWAIVSIINSNRDIGTKVLWIVLVLILPVIGLIAWLLVGPRGGRA
jgi:hypothetical protein